MVFASAFNLQSIVLVVSLPLATAQQVLSAYQIENALTLSRAERTPRVSLIYALLLIVSTIFTVLRPTRLEKQAQKFSLTTVLSTCSSVSLSARMYVFMSNLRASYPAFKRTHLPFISHLHLGCRVDKQLVRF